MLKESLSKRLNDIMVKLNISNTELAKNLSMPIQTIQKIRTGINENPTISTLQAIAEYFKITVSQLIGERPIMENKIPILTLEQILTWPLSVADNLAFSFLMPTNSSNEIFAIIINDNNYEDLFVKDEILLIDPVQQVSGNSYILVNRAQQSKPSIKKVLEEDGKLYLKSVISGIDSLIPLNSEHLVLGVIIASYKLFISN